MLRLFDSFGSLDGRALEEMADRLERMERQLAGSGGGFIQTSSGTIVLPSKQTVPAIGPSCHLVSNGTAPGILDAGLPGDSIQSYTFSDGATVGWDDGGFFTPGNLPYITFPVTGRYLIVGRFGNSSLGNDYIAQLCHRPGPGSPFSLGFNTFQVYHVPSTVVPSAAAWTITDIWDVTAGDRLEAAQYRPDHSQPVPGDCSVRAVWLQGTSSMTSVPYLD